MFDISQLTQKELIQRSTLKEIIKLVALSIDSPPATQALAILLERKLKEADLEFKNPDSFKVYQALTLLLKFQCLNVLRDQEVLDLIESHALEALSFKSHFLDVLRSKMFNMPIIFRDDYLQKLKGALQRNKQRLGTKPIKVIQYSEPVEPFAAYWLLDYDTALGSGFHQEAERELYFSGSPNVKMLTDQEKELLRGLFAFYDLLKLSTREPGGLASYSLESMVGLAKLDPRLIKKLEKMY